ncbi:MAG TPA: tol-pal system protein YbgF [Thermoanaerobaculia bacterium]|nr:tol-pal system protein YbgF [Thermoanaerobaculia bacterium]
MKITRTLAVLGLLLTTGCATSSDMEKLQSQISDLQDQVAQLKRTASSKEEVQNVNSKIAEQTQTLLKSNATLVAKVGEIEEKMNNTQGSVEQTNYRIDRIVQQVTQAQHDVDDLKAQNAARAAAATMPGAEGVPGPSMAEVTVAPPATTENPLEVYQAAYRDYQRGNYDLAISGFRDFLSRNPASDLADNASYWVGESLFSQKKYREAIEQFDSVVTKYPKSDKVPGALLKKGYAYISLNEKAQGIVQLQYVVHEHPQSPEAALARQKLKQLGVETR